MLASSRPRTVLILSTEEDEHVGLVTPLLEESGARVVLFDPSWYPDKAEVQFSLNQSGDVVGIMRGPGCEVRLEDVTAAWHRRPGSPRSLAQVQDPSLDAFIESASRQLLDGLWEALSCRWLPTSPARDRYLHNKVSQLQLAKRLGFHVPETTVGNSVDATVSFFSRLPSGVVSKSLVQRPLAVDDVYIPALYTRRVDRRDLRRIASVRRSPTIFQEAVPKSSELRVTIVGEQVLAAEILSQEYRATRHDWRHYHDSRVRYRPCELPAEVRSLCLRYLRELELSFGALDFVRNPDGRMTFLEINPNGQWGFIQKWAGLPIAEAIADFLLATGDSRAAG